MALTVGELVAYIRADGTQFDSQVDQSGRKFEGLGKVVAAGTRTVAQGFVGLTTGAVAMGAAVYKVGADYNRLQQSSRAALTTLLGSAEAANAQMDKLDAFARNSPFTKQVFITAQQQLLGFGMQAERVLPTLDAIQNAVAATGGSAEDISEITRVLAQVESTGKITANTLNQLGVRGVDAATLIGSQMGMTGEQIREAITSGSLDAGQAIDALVAGMTARFGGATDLIKLQMDGAADRVKGAWRDIGAVIAAPFVDPNGGGRVVEWTNKLADALRAAEAKAKPFVDLMVTRFGPGLDAVTPVLDRARGAINAWDLSKVNSQLDRLTGYTPLISAGAAALFAYGAGTLPVLRNLGIGLNPVVAGVAALVATSPALRSAGQEFLTALSPLVPVLVRVGAAVADAASGVLDELVPASRDLLQAAAPLIVALASGLSPALVAVLQAAAPLASVIADVATGVANLPTPVLAGVAAFMLLHGPINRLVTTLGGPLQTAFAAFSQTLAASRVTLELTGRSTSAMNVAMVTARAGVQGVGTALTAAFMSNPVGLAITALTTAVTAFAVKSMEAKARARAYAESVKLLGTEAEEAARKVAANAFVTGDGLDWGWFQSFTTKFGSFIDLADAAGVSVSQLTDAVMMSDAEFEAWSDSIWDAAQAAGLSRAAITELLTKVGQQRTALGDARDAQERMNEVTGEGTREQRSNAEAVQAANDALQEQIRAQRDAAGAAMSLREAQIAQTESQEAANRAAAEGVRVARDQSGAVDLNAASTIAADRALLDLAARNAQVTEAMRKQNASGQELYDTTVQQRNAFVDTAESMGYTRDEAARLARQYGLIPQTVTTTIRAETTEADGAITRVVERLNHINGRVYTAVIRVDQQGNTTVNTGVGNMIARAEGAFTPRPASRLRPMADGGVGGRQAQYAAAGSWIVWAEDETGGETYIPHHPAKRARSTALLDQTAREFGYRLIPAGAEPRANGAVSSPSTIAAPAPAPIVINLEGVRVDQAEEVVSAIVWELRRLERGGRYGVAR
ncbi:tape measure protein [Cellulomonas hominis]|uniref:Tape measure protein n=1 Tax=Cellulomonas hominis TaxID=156981 RepID=A0A7Z8K3W0_9CELL|nr:tape measure protein [Cellulomonas hominis]TKR27131.1 tape measure protein [Cellulomonas hominis]